MALPYRNPTITKSQARDKITPRFRYLVEVLSPKTQYSLVNAQAYFQEHLAAADYYTENISMRGEWIGKGARQLELQADVHRDEFLALCANEHPRVGGLLTQKQLSRRTQRNAAGYECSVANRRVFYDFTISAPKSVSIAALLAGDLRILDAHRQAVTAAVQAMEPFAETRVRTGGLSTDRTTGNLVCALFTHTTSRALDPHLHTHCVAFNATFDPVEKRWKALQNRQLLRAQKFVENVYYHSLAQSLLATGYGIRNHRRGDFDLREISQEWCTRFSKRHAEIERKTHALLEAHPEKASQNVYRIRENIAQRQRQTKIAGIGSAQLRERWISELSPEEQTLVAAIPRTLGRTLSSGISAEEALTWADRHLFERRSVVAEHELWRHALEFGRGSGFDVLALKRASAERCYLRNSASPDKVSLTGVLEREWQILEMVKAGVGRYSPFAPDIAGGGHPAGLDPEQQKAVTTILASRDLVTLFRGGAGTGKSFTLQAVVREIVSTGASVQVIAPQRQQASDLEAAGLHGATTVSEFLAKRSIIPGAVVVLDEAGQVGATQMESLLCTIREAGARLICSGDTRQHGAVESSDALRTIERYAGIQAAEIQTIRRQDPAQAETLCEAEAIREYRKAVAEAAHGSAEQSLARLERLGAVIECSPEERHRSLAETYADLAQKQQTVLVIGQTWTEVRQLNQAVRFALQRCGRVETSESALDIFEPVDVTDAQKLDARFYSAQSTVVFTRSMAGFRKNAHASVIEVTRAGLVVSGDGKVREIAISKLKYLRLCERRVIHIASGDKLQLKANATTHDGRRLCNGELVTVERVTADGRLLLRDGRQLPPDYRQFGYGFAVTSYASQGKTVDHVLFSDSGVRAATNREQWYVTISRGRKSVRVFTSDKESLQESIGRSGHRELAIDVFGAPVSGKNEWAQRWDAILRRIGERIRRISSAGISERCGEISSRMRHD